MNFPRIILLIVLLGYSGDLQAEATNVPLSTPQQQHDQTVQPSRPESAGETELFDIKGPIEIKDTGNTVIITTAGVAGLILLIILIIIWRKRSRKQRAILAHETALQKLAQAQQLIDAHEIDSFVTLIDQTLRTYIEQRFGVSARRQTTREFITTITKSKKRVEEQLTSNKSRLQTWLEHCDMVKFAKADMSAETMGEMLTNLRSFIDSTRMEAEN
ncbi:MAG: hypothetical protein JRF04_00350 [Deltaproteobacteria bacterium]|nr:hypothetical protein [Deltaproteobacteria bacterium]